MHISSLHKGELQKMKEKLVSGFQKLSKAIVVPVMYLPAIGLVIAFVGLFISPSIVDNVGILQIKFLNDGLKILHGGLMSVFQNLGPIFTIGVAMGLARKKKEQAALVAFMALFIYLMFQNLYLSTNNLLADPSALYGSGQSVMLGIQAMDTGVFMGIVIGIIVGCLHNAYCDKDLGNIFSIYAGTRFVFLISILVMLFLSVGIVLVWPYIQDGISNLAYIMKSSGPFGYFLFGFLERLLIPTGLHHLIGSPIWYSELGGIAEIGGEVYAGAWNVAIAELSNPEVMKLSTTVIFNNTNLVKIFGLTGAGLAMIRCAKPEKMKQAKMILIPAMLTSILAGITEPLEFTFLFLSPLLFLIYSLLSGVFFGILAMFDITTITAGGIIETLALNLPISPDKSNYLLYALVGLVQFLLFYVVFKFYILKFNLKTPGREDGEESTKLMSKKDYEEAKKVGDTKIPELILKGIGGLDNINSVDNCFTRLRISVIDVHKVDKAVLEQAECKGVVLRQNEIQIIYGTNVGKYRKLFDDYVERLEA